MIAKIEQLIRTSDITGIDTVACGDQACQGQLFRFKIEDGEGKLRCYGCGRVAVIFKMDTYRPERN